MYFEAQYAAFQEPQVEQESTTERHAVQQGVGDQFARTERDVVDADGLAPAREGAADELPCERNGLWVRR